MAGKKLPAPKIRKSLLASRKEREEESTFASAAETFRAPITNELTLRQEGSSSLQDDLNKERLREIRFKAFFRIVLSLFFLGLLAWQNWQVFSIVVKAFDLKQLKDLQPIFAGLIAATRTETYFVTKIIVNFIFSTTNYSGVEN